MTLSRNFDSPELVALALRAEVDSNDRNLARLVFLHPNEVDLDVVVEYRRKLDGWAAACEVRVDGELWISHGTPEDYRDVFEAIRERAWKAEEAERDARRAAQVSEVDELVATLSKRAEKARVEDLVDKLV